MQKRSNQWQITPTITVEKHVSFLFEPVSTYFTHVAPKTGSSERARKELLKELKSKSIELHRTQVQGCDGTAVNTEVKKRVIPILETSLQRSLSWLVYQLPRNELLLRYVSFFTLTQPQKNVNIFFILIERIFCLF